MKRIVSLLICIICITTFVFPVNAFSIEKNNLNGVELSALRLSSKIAGKDKIEIANKFLSAIGMEEEWIKKVPTSKKIEIADAKSIQKITEYSKIDTNGESVVLSEKQFIKESSVTLSSLENSVSTKESGEVPEDGLHIPDDGKDEYLIKNLYIYKTKNAPTGTYAVVVTYEWKNFSIRWRGEEIIGISGDGLVFSRNSFYFSGEYKYIHNLGTTAETGIVNVNADADSLEDDSDLMVKENGIVFQFNLINDIPSLLTPLNYTEASFIVCVSSRVSDWSSPKSFNIKSSYFHQKIGLGSLGVSVDITGVNFSVEPSYAYKECPISTEEPITYIPE